MPKTTRRTNGVTAVIPAYNEAKTIKNVIEKLHPVRELTEILVIDDGSSDGTPDIARKAGATVIVHSRNRGKGAAMKSGARYAKNKYLIYVDADIENMTSAKIRRLVKPLISGEADFVKAGYTYSAGRVTKLVVKPLLKIIYPFLDLEHPLSGEVALNKQKFDFDNIEDNWGVDIQLVLQAARKKLRIAEVKLGNKEHKHQDLNALSKMSEQIIKTILMDLQLIAHKYKLICFDLDKTLIPDSSIRVLAKAWGFEAELKDLFKRQKAGEFDDKEITKRLAKHFTNKTQAEVDEVCEQIEINPHAATVIEQLRRQRYRVRIVSSAFSPVVKHFANRLRVADFVCPRISQDKNRRYTGRLKPSRFEDDGSCGCGLYVCKKRAVNFVRKRFKASNEECMGIGDGKNDRCMFEACGLSLGYYTDIADHRIENFAEVLMYVD